MEGGEIEREREREREREEYSMDYIMMTSFYNKQGILAIYIMMTSYSMDDIMMTSFYKLTCRSQWTVPESLLQQIWYQIRRMRRRVPLF